MHIFLNDSGAANEIIRKLTSTIQHLVESSNLIQLKATSTDGDPGHQWIYQDALKIILSISPDLNIDLITSAINTNNISHLACADMLHYMKTMRTKLLTLVLSLFTYNTDHTFSFDSIKEELGDEGDEVTDLSHLGKMRDSYVLKLFTLTHLNLLINSNKWDAVLFFLPITLWLTSVTNTLYTPAARVFMLKVSFDIYKH